MGMDMGMDGHGAGPACAPGWGPPAATAIPSEAREARARGQAVSLARCARTQPCRLRADWADPPTVRLTRALGWRGLLTGTGLPAHTATIMHASERSTLYHTMASTAATTDPMYTSRSLGSATALAGPLLMPTTASGPPRPGLALDVHHPSPLSLNAHPLTAGLARKGVALQI